MKPSKIIKAQAAICYRKLCRRGTFEMTDLENEGWLVYLKVKNFYDPKNSKASFSTYLTKCLMNHFSNIVKTESRHTKIIEENRSFLLPPPDLNSCIVPSTKEVKTFFECLFNPPEDLLEKMELAAKNKSLFYIVANYLGLNYYKGKQLKQEIKDSILCIGEVI